MRRPAIDPWTRDQLVSQRNMMQGMAAGRVPSAYPVPPVRVPRMLAGVRGPASAPPEAPESTTSGSFFNYPNSTDLSHFDASKMPIFRYQTEGVAVVFLSTWGLGAAAPTGWTVHGSGTASTYLDYVVASRVLTGTDDWLFDLPSLPADWNDEDVRNYWHKMLAFGAFFTGPHGSIAATVSTVAASSVESMPTPAGSLTAPWNAMVAAHPTGPSGDTLETAWDPSIVGSAHVHYGTDSLFAGAQGGGGYSVAVVDTEVTTYDFLTSPALASCAWVKVAFGWV